MSTAARVYVVKKDVELPPYIEYHDPVVSPFFEHGNSILLQPDYGWSFEVWLRHWLEHNLFEPSSRLSVPVTQELIDKLRQDASRWDKDIEFWKYASANEKAQWIGTYHPALLDELTKALTFWIGHRLLEVVS